MARGLLIWVLVMSAGCVLPQSDSNLNTPLPLKNRPPRIIESPRPFPRSKTVDNTATCSKIVFGDNLAADDPDLCDTLTVRWYVDYDATSRPSADQTSTISPPSPAEIDAGTASTTRSLASAAYTFNPLHFSKPGITFTGPHVLEVLVSDGEVTDSPRGALPRQVLQQCFPPPLALFPDGGPASDQTYFVTYAWTVVVNGSGCLP